MEMLVSLALFNSGLHFSVICKINHSIDETHSIENTQKFYGLKGRIFHVLHKEYPIKKFWKKLR
jgi:hypothetical protein